MAKKDIKLNINSEVKKFGKALEASTRAIFEGSSRISAPSAAPTIRGKRKTAQFSFNLRGDGKKKNKIQRKAEIKIMNKAFKENAVRLEKEIQRVMMIVIMGVIGVGSKSIRVFGKSLGNVKQTVKIESTPFAKFIKSPKGAGEIGLPDPNKSINELKVALTKAIRVNVTVLSRGPVIKLTFDQRKLLTLTPHPVADAGSLGRGVKFFSWLSLVTGPDFLSNGTPDHGLVRVSDIKKRMRKIEKDLTKNSSGMRGAKLYRRLESFTAASKAPRTLQNAGQHAALMLKTKPGKTKFARTKAISQAESMGGVTDSYKPSSKFNGYWDQWWMMVKKDIGSWSRRIMGSAVKSVLRGA